MELITTPEL